MRILGIDYGDARIGLALSDASATLCGRAWTLTEWNLERAVAAIADVVRTEGVERIVGFLPLNHVAAQYVDTMILLYNPITVFMARPDALKGTLTETLKKAKPTVFVTVPRVYEKMMEAIKKGTDANEAMKAASGTYGRFADAVRYIDPREE